MQFLMTAATKFCACVAIAALCAPRTLASSTPCTVNVLSQVERRAGNSSLADLLSPGVCPTPLRAAKRIFIGRVPHTGTRALEGADVRERLRVLLNAATHESADGRVHVPERIQLSQAGSDVTCAAIASRLLPHLNPQSTEKAECGLFHKLKPGTGIELVRAHWDPLLQSWDLTARCIRPEDCIPFLVRVPGQLTDQASAPGVISTLKKSDAEVLVHAGQKSEVIWESAGLRFALPSIVLGPGKAGDTVRVRLQSGRTMLAVVSAEGGLQVQQ